MVEDGLVFFICDDVLKRILCWVVIFILVYFIGLVFYVEIVYDWLVIEVWCGCIRGCCFC